MGENEKGKDLFIDRHRYKKKNVVMVETHKMRVREHKRKKYHCLVGDKVF